MAIHPAARCRSEPATRMVKVTFRENPCIDMEEDVMEQQIMQPQTNAGAAQEQRHPIAIEAIDLVKDYGHGENAVHALRGVNVRFEQGRFTAIMGPSGSGKSTLMHTLAGLDSATSGHIVFDGADITTMNDNQLTMLRRHKIGFIFQSFNLLPMFTAEQNILMPLTLAGQKPDRQWFDMLTTTLGLKEGLTNRPNDLSGGQQQRVAIARALITKPSLVFADEPTGNLDSVSSAEVLSFLKRSVKELGQTVIMVTHDAVAASYADRATVFADGQIVADEQRPTAESMNQLLMNERERATQLVGGPSAGTTVPRPPVAALKGHTEKASFVPGAPHHPAVAQHRRRPAHSIKDFSCSPSPSNS